MPQPETAVQLLALALAFAGAVASLHLSLGMKLKACPLCFYQRSYVFMALATLSLGWLGGPFGGLTSFYFAIPMAVAGWAVAGFHVRLVRRRVLECPAGLFGWGPAPLQSFLYFSALAVALIAGLVAFQPWNDPIAMVLHPGGGIALGLVMGWLSLIANPPLPPVPTQPYGAPPEICRPPFKPAAGDR